MVSRTIAYKKQLEYRFIRK